MLNNEFNNWIIVKESIRMCFGNIWGIEVNWMFCGVKKIKSYIYIFFLYKIYKVFEFKWYLSILKSDII